nr:hypothetical protein [uncultured Psychrobacter sp.]
MHSIDKAYQFYTRHIFDKEKINLLETHNLKVAGSVPSVLWELFGALLTERTGSGLIGADLQGWEVKSAKEGGSYEYQYHLNTGSSKLNEDCEVNHLFCMYSKTYENVIVRAIQGSDLAEHFFKLWEPYYTKNYDVSIEKSQRRQRFRKSISGGYVEKNGTLIMEVKEGKLVYRNNEIIPKLNRVI